MKTVEELEKEIKEIENKVNVTTKEYQDAMKSHVENMEKVSKELKKKKYGFEPTPKGWVPWYREDYYYANREFTLEYGYRTSRSDEIIIGCKRVFKTRKECQLYCNVQKGFENASRRFLHGKNNYLLRYDYTEKKMYIENFTRLQYPLIGWHSKQVIDEPSLCFANEETIQNLIDKFGEENVKRYYLGVY